MTQNQQEGLLNAAGPGKGIAMFAHSTSDTPSTTATTTHDEDGQICPTNESSAAALSQRQPQRQPYGMCPESDMDLDDIIRSDSVHRSDGETSPGIDNITHRLSDSHLQVEGFQYRPSLSRKSMRTYSSASSYLPPNFLKWENDDRSQKPFLSASTAPSVMVSPFPSPLKEDRGKTPTPTHPRQDVKPLRRQMSSRFNKNPQHAWEIETLVEGMVSMGEQCTVYTVPQAPVTPTNADITSGFVTNLRLDENLGDESHYESQFVEEFLSLRRASGTTGVRKSGFPLQPSATDAALRCRHLVRKKPRMRNRSKMKPRPSLARLPPGEESSVGSYSATS